MVNRARSRGKRAAFFRRMSVEAIVVILVAAATVAIFAMKIMAGVWEDSDSPVRNKVAGLRHDAMSPAPLSDSSQDVATATAGQSQEQSNVTVVHNGVTVLSPRLLVPVIDADVLETANGSAALTSQPKATQARKRSHYANRSQARSHRRVVRSAPFWRIVAR